MDFLKAAILGVIEGLTEFMPVSSTFHLLLAARISGLAPDEFTKLFEIFIQAGAILAVVWLYRRQILTRFDLAAKTIVAFLPTALFGIVFYRPIKNVFFEKVWAQVFIFILVGLVFIGFEFLIISRGFLRLNKSIAALSWREAVLVGSGQALSFFPGVSRAGAVIIIMMLLGYRRAEAALFSFFLAIPTILSAALFDLFKSRHSLVTFSRQIMPLSFGFFISFLVALVAVRWFISYLQTHNLVFFGFYRLLLGGLAILYFLLML